MDTVVPTPTFENHRIQHFGAINWPLPLPWYLTKLYDRWSPAFGRQIFYYRINNEAEFNKALADPKHPFHPR